MIVYIFAIILVIIIAVLAILAYMKEKNNKKDQSKSYMFPFTGRVKDGILTLKNSNGGPQIDCSSVSTTEKKSKISGSIFFPLV